MREGPWRTSSLIDAERSWVKARGVWRTATGLRPQQATKRNRLRMIYRFQEKAARCGRGPAAVRPNHAVAAVCGLFR